MMAVAVIGGALVSGGILPAVWGGVAVAVGSAGGFFHVTEDQSKSAK